MVLPTVRPIAAKLCREPFDSPDWLFEIKHDGFRALAHRFSKFSELEESLAPALRGRFAILDGEIVCLDGKGRAVFSDLLHVRASPYFYAFDILWLDNDDWRFR